SVLSHINFACQRSDDLNLGEVFQTMSKKEHTKVWTSLLKTVAPIVDEGRFLSQEEQEEGEEQVCQRVNAIMVLPQLSSRSRSRSRSNGATLAATDEPAGQPEEEGTTPGRPSAQECEHRSKKKRSQASVSLAMEVLHSAAVLAHEFLADKGRVAPRPLIDTAVYLHDIILSLQGLQGDALQAVIGKVCEMWWTQERPGAEHLVSRLLPMMLVRSVDVDAKEADVKRMFGLRAALLLLDFEDESGDSLRGLLLRTFISPVYLKCSEGRRLLASFFGLHPTLVAEIHAVIKAQMPGAKKGVLAAYGEVYFRVWRGAEGPYLENVEMLCLQASSDDLMHACIHASTPKMHQNILAVLDGLHSQKKARLREASAGRGGGAGIDEICVKGVDAGLLRLYGPVMWRSLRVANPSVRAQACQVLVDAFPLQDPSAGAATYDATLQQQFDALTDLLEDGHPQVRAVAAKGACRVLSLFWEMVPIETTRALLTRVVGRLASDGASPVVRLAAVEGMSVLLECPASHGVLKSMLPGVQTLIHDTNKKVRTAFVKLLLVVKGVKSIKYYQVVNVDHILARLSEDHLKCPASAMGLSKLILNSYFPTGSGVTGSFQVSRCLTLLSQDEGAAVAFFSRLHQNAGVPSAAKVIAMLVRCVLVAARKPPPPPLPPGGDAGGEGEGGGEEGKENKGKASRKGKRKVAEKEGEKNGGQKKEGAQLLSLSDPKTMSGILNLVASIWESILPGLAKSVNEPSLGLIQQTITGDALTILHRRFSGHDGCRAAFLRVAGLAGGDLAPGMLEEIVVEMLALPPGAPPSTYGPTVDLLCSWGQHEHLVGAVVGSLTRAFAGPGRIAQAESGTIDDGSDSTTTKAGSRGKRRRPASRKVGHGDDEQVTGLPAPLAINMLGHLLAGGKGHPSTVAARGAIMANDEAVGSLEAVLVLARSTATARLSSAATPALCITAATAKKREAEEEEHRRRCPDALLVRAVEALGRVYMHREAALVVEGSGGGGGVASAGAVAQQGGGGGGGGGGGAGGGAVPRVEEEQQQQQQEAEEMSMLQPTNTVLPVLVGGVNGGGGFGIDTAEGGGTPVRPAGASLVAESPSPLPPPRSRARAISSNDDASSAAAAAAAAAEASAAGAAMAVTLAGSVFGVVVLLASEWVEVGSGLAEISMRADTWGNRLLASLIEEEDEGGVDSINAVLPQLCRLSLHLSVRESQGARPPSSIWEVLLRCADRCVAFHEGAMVTTGETEEEGSSATYVQKYLAVSVALQARIGGMSSLSERLMSFMFTQAFTSDEEDGQENQVEENAYTGPSTDALTRLEVRAVQDLDSDEAAGSLLLQLSRPAAAVLASVVRSAPASRAVGALALSHLTVFGASGDDSADASWPLFCAHILGALIEHAPAKTRLQLAADAHAGLKDAAAATSSSSSSSVLLARSSDNCGGGGGSSVATSPGASESAAAAAAASVSLREEEGVSTRKAAAFAVGAIYGRLEAARRAATEVAAVGVKEMVEVAPGAVAVSA
ncbi:unnamed protein product, partial [Pylaiella littoralis]